MAPSPAGGGPGGPLRATQTRNRGTDARNVEVLYAHGAGGLITPSAQRNSPILRGAAVFTGALLLCWPAFFNRYPLLYPDSITYLADGRAVARALFLHKFSDYYGMRSLLYSLVIQPFHRNVSPWPVVYLQAAVAAYVLWLVVRSLVKDAAISRYLLLVSALSLLTSASWYVSLVMPDVLGPLLYLCAYLLVFAPESLSGGEHGTVVAIAWWAAVSHVTHLVLAAGLCALFALLWMAGRAPARQFLRGTCELALVVTVAAASQMALGAYLFGTPSLGADTPPFLVARLIADGPGRWYLQKHCGELDLALCESVGKLPDNSDDFLWSPGGIWDRATREGDNRIREEEIPFALGVLRTYPRQELGLMASNFWEQLSTFGLWDLAPNEWALENLESALPGKKADYLKGWQANDELPLGFYSELQYWVVAVSLAAIALLLPFLAGRRSLRLLGLALIVLSTLLANALLAGALSNVEDRYQCRVIWLLPLAAGLSMIYWMEVRRIERRACGSATWHDRD